MEFIIFIDLIHFSFIVRVGVNIFSDQMKFFEQLQQNLKINVKLEDLKKQIINSTYFGASKRICWRLWANRIKRRRGWLICTTRGCSTRGTIVLIKDPQSIKNIY